MSEGWKCPGCGACYAPWVYSCTRCVPVRSGTITTSPQVWPGGTAAPFPRPPQMTCSR